MMDLQIGQRVYAATTLSDDDWWIAAWDEEVPPFEVLENTPGTVIKRSEREPYLYTVQFDCGIECCVVYTEGVDMQEVLPLESVADA